MLVEMAIADAYGIAFEFCDNTPDRPNDLSRYYQHPTYAAVKPGQYTDDTQRALANVNVLLRDQQYDAKEYAKYYLGILKIDHRDGYGRGYQKFLETTPTPETFIKTIKRTKTTNGSLMGVAPLGYLRTPGEVSMAATVQAATTHSFATIPYACGVALAAHYFIYNLGPKNRLALWLSDQVDFGSLVSNEVDDRLLIQRTKGTAQATFWAMMRGLEAHDNLADIIRWAVDCGGDTDSCAAVTVAVASCSDEFEQNIPRVLLDGLENGPYGRDYLGTMDGLLYAMAHTPS